MRIWKWILEIADRQTIPMPAGAKILSVQTQSGDCSMWALCDETANLKERHFAIYGTGNPMPDEPGEYVGTFLLVSGSLVIHVFEVQ